MSSTENAKNEVIRMFDGKSINDVKSETTKAVNALAEEYGDMGFAKRIIESLDLDHDGLINMQFQNSVINLSNVDAESILTPEGKYYLKQIEND